MNFKKSVLYGICEGLKFKNNYRIEIHTIITENLGVPQSIKTQYGIGNRIMFSIRSDQNPQAEIDFDKNELVWNTSFNHTPSVISVPIDSIIRVVDSGEISGLHFLEKVEDAKEPVRSEIKTDVPVQNLPRVVKQVPTSELFEPEMVVLKKKHLVLLRCEK